MAAAIRIVERARIAQVAAWVLKQQTCALVLGRTIFLHGANRQAYLSDERWLRHEAAHLLQYRRYGMAGFLLRYLWYSLRYGYRNNPLEQEARRAETDTAIVRASGLAEIQAGVS